MRMLITLFSLLFILGAHNTAHADDGYTIRYVCDLDGNKQQDAFISCAGTPCQKTRGRGYDYFYEQQYHIIVCDNPGANMGDCSDEDLKNSLKITNGKQIHLRFKNNSDLTRCLYGDSTVSFNYTFNKCSTTPCAGKHGSTEDGGKTYCYHSTEQENCLNITHDGEPLDFNFCNNPGYKLAGWWVYNDYTAYAGNIYDDPEKEPNGVIIYAEDASEDFKNENPGGIDMNALVWKWTPTSQIKNFYAVWEPITQSCAPGEYVSGEDGSCEPCKAGHYCPGKKNFQFINGTNQGLSRCPAGSTSNVGAIAISDCFVKPFVSQFSTSSGITFALPGLGSSYETNPHYTGN